MGYWGAWTGIPAVLTPGSSCKGWSCLPPLLVETTFLILTFRTIQGIFFCLFKATLWQTWTLKKLKAIWTFVLIWQQVMSQTDVDGNQARICTDHWHQTHYSECSIAKMLSLLRSYWLQRQQRECWKPLTQVGVLSPPQQVYLTSYQPPTLCKHFAWGVYCETRLHLFRWLQEKALISKAHEEVFKQLILNRPASSMFSTVHT